MLRVTRELACSETSDPGPHHTPIHVSEISKVPDNIWAGRNVREVAALTGIFAD